MRFRQAEAANASLTALGPRPHEIQFLICRMISNGIRSNLISFMESSSIWITSLKSLAQSLATFPLPTIPVFYNNAISQGYKVGIVYIGFRCPFIGLDE